ncbi:MAG: RHS repeat protein, partial [Clostridia bacterium]|nr:RHS repeat protein [Clostridia bacterium]
MKNEKLNLNESNEIKDSSAEELSLMSVSETESTTEVESPDKYVDHQQYYTTENGRAGVGSVNLFDGSFTFEHLDLEAKGVKMPMTLSHIYRDRFMKNDQAQTGLPVFPYGMGWRLSVAQRLCDSDDRRIIKIYIDAQGKEYHFLTDYDGSIYDQEGAGLSYAQVGDKHHVIDEQDNKMIFNSDGILVEMRDCHGTKSLLSYSEDGYLTKIQNGIRDDGSTTPQIITLTYEQNKLVKVQESGGYTITYEYDGKYLKSITYPSSDSGCCEGVLQTKFYYYNNHLYRIIDQSGMEYFVSHELEGKVTKIRLDGNLHVSPCCAVHGSSSIADEKNFEYRAHSTVVEDELTKIKTVYRFDENGRPILSYRDLIEMEGTFFNDGSYLDTTLADLAEYSLKRHSIYSVETGKYRSLSVQLSRAAENEMNLLKDSDFSKYVAGLDSEWTTEGSSAGIGNETILSDHYSVWLRSSISQTISGEELEEQSGNVLVVSAWVKPSDVIQTSTVTLKVSMEYEETPNQVFERSFSCDGGVWQFVAFPVALAEKKDISSMTIQFSGSSGSFTMPRAVVVHSNTTTITFPRIEIDFAKEKEHEIPAGYEISIDDDFWQKKIDIYMVTSSEDSNYVTKNLYDSNMNLFLQIIFEVSNERYCETKLLNGDKKKLFWQILFAYLGFGFKTEYEYDSRHNLLKATDSFGMVTEYEYTDEGEVSSEKRYRLDTPNIWQKTDYTYENGHYLKTESDPRHTMDSVLLQTTYEYHPQKWLMTKQTAPNGQAYHYDYDLKTEELRKISSTVGEQTLSNEFCYTMGYPTSVSHNGFSYDFGFDGIGRQNSIHIAGNELARIDYDDDIERSVTTTYATGESMKIEYDIFGAPARKYYMEKDDVEPNMMMEKIYDSAGNVKEVIDIESNLCYTYTYDSNGKVTRIEEKKHKVEKGKANPVVATTFEYDDTERLTSKTYESTGQTYCPEYESSTSCPGFPLRTVMGLSLEGVYENKVTLDELRRVKCQVLSLESANVHEPFMTVYSYLEPGTDSKIYQSNFVSFLTNYRQTAPDVYVGTTFNYTYDRAGNIETVTKDNTLIAKYKYDRLNRLTREDNYESGKTTVFSYDVGGNITSKKEYAVTSANTPTGSY